MNIWVDANGWPIPPIVLLGCLVAELLYFRGWRILVNAEQSKRAARTKSSNTFSDPGAGECLWNSWFWRGTYFLAAIFTLLLTSSAPIDYFSSRFFWVHMVQHLLLLVIIAPLLVAGTPLLPLWLGLPGWARRIVKRLKAGHAFYQVGKLLRQPAISCALLFIGMWVWHWPPLYDLALTNGAIHDWCEHTTFVAVSFLFWTQVIPSPPLHSRPGYLGRIGCVGFAIMQNVVLAVLIAFAPSPLYAPYAHLAHVHGVLSALIDQQLGAGIMWTFGDVPFVISIFILVQAWLASQSDSTESANNTRLPLDSHYNMQREMFVEVEGVNATKSGTDERN